MAIKKKGVLITKNRNSEIDDETPVNVIMLPEYHFRRGAFLVISKELAKLLKNRDLKLTALDHSLFYALYERVEANNRIKTFTQALLAEELHADRSNISRSFRKLIKLGIIEYIDLDYYFNEKYVWTGGRKPSQKK